MAIYKRDIVDINLETGNIHRSFLKHSIGYLDQAADHFGIRVLRNGEPVDLTGVTVQGIFMPPQGNPIAITTGNIIEGNVAEVVLPQACYNYDGQFCLSIKLVDATNAITGTMRIVDGMVDNTHASGTVAPTETVPTYQEILSVYADMVTALVTVDELDDEVSDLKSAIAHYIDNGEGTKVGIFEQGFYYTTPESGTAVSKLTSAIYATTLIPVVAGDAIFVNASASTGNSRLYVFINSDGNAIGRCDVNMTGERVLIAPEGAIYCAVNNRTATQATGYYAYNGNYTGWGINKRIINMSWRTGRINDDGTSASDTTRIRTIGYYKFGCQLKITIPSGYKIKVFSYTGWDVFTGIKVSNFYTDTFILKTDVNMWYRFMIGKTDDSTITTAAVNDFTFTDYNGYIELESTGDTTDRTNEINSLLIEHGYVKLGAGIFYVNGISMRNNSTLEGVGKSTQLILSDAQEANCISMASGCLVQNVEIIGSLTDIEVSSELSGRNGIAYVGTGTGHETTISKGTITGCYIHGFSGSGIYASNTGDDTTNGLHINNCYIYNCGAGINIYYSSEFHRINNCTLVYNYYGCINNGGNNVITCCGIDSNAIGFLIDASGSDGVTKYNSSHGVLSDSTVEHNTVCCVKMIGAANQGYLIASCNLGSNSGGRCIDLYNVGRIIFNGCRISKDQTIYIDGGWLVLFTGCQVVHNGSSSHSECIIQNNEKVRFSGCYDDNGNEFNGQF